MGGESVGREKSHSSHRKVTKYPVHAKVEETEELKGCVPCIHAVEVQNVASKGVRVDKKTPVVSHFHELRGLRRIERIWDETAFPRPNACEQQISKWERRE